MFTAYIEPMLMITGAVTASMIGLCLAPRPLLRLLFGGAPQDAVSLLIARHWGLLVACVGALLIYAAFEPAIRVPVLWAAVAEKLALVALVMGTTMRQHGLAAAVAGADLLMSLIYLAYLAGF